MEFETKHEEDLYNKGLSDMYESAMMSNVEEMFEESGFISLNEDGVMLTFRILPILLTSKLPDKFDPEALKIRTGKILNKCKTKNDVNYLKRDRTLAIGQMTTMLKNIEGYQKDPDTYRKTLSKSFIRHIENGDLKTSDVKKYIQWLKTDYLKMLNDKAKELK